MQTSFYQFTFKELSENFNNENKTRANLIKIFKSVWRERKDFLTISQVSRELIKNLSQNFTLELPQILQVQSSEDGTHKMLVGFLDHEAVETVLIPFHRRYTVCLSSQVGCAMKCSFCYTGMQGYKRNLSVAEIVGQYLLAFDWLRENVDKKVLAPNIVFMGQGEPLQNFEAVKKSIEIFVDKSGLALSSRQITLSTAGYLPGLVKFSELPKVNLALSLHSTNETTRDELIPLNKTYPIKELFAVIDQLPRLKRQYITCEYLLIDGLNMEDSDVQGLTSLLKDRPAIINLIAFNPFPGSQYKRPTRKQVDDFRKKLVQNKLHVMVRTTKGAEILAACGQLNTRV